MYLYQSLRKFFLMVLAVGAAVQGHSKQDKITQPAMSSELDPTLADWQSTLPHVYEHALPHGCEEFTLIKGDPEKADIFLLGEAHNKHCSLAREKCANALVRDALTQPTETTTKTIVSLLFEFASYGKHILCAEQGEGLGKISDDCRGWNELESLKDIRHEKFSFAPKKGAFILQQLEEIDRKGLNPIKTIVEIIDQHQKDTLKYEKSHRARYLAFKKTHPTVEIKDFYSDADLYVKGLKFQIKKLEIILQKLKNGLPLSQVIKAQQHEVELSQEERVNLANNIDEMIGKPNQYLVASIKEARKRSQKVVAFAGALHVTTFNPKAALTDDERAVIQTLYDELDQFADENPYAILACYDPENVPRRKFK